METGFLEGLRGLFCRGQELWTGVGTLGFLCFGRPGGVSRVVLRGSKFGDNPSARALGQAAREFARLNTLLVEPAVTVEQCRFHRQVLGHKPADLRVRALSCS